MRIRGHTFVTSHLFSPLIVVTLVHSAVDNECWTDSVLYKFVKTCGRNEWTVAPAFEARVEEFQVERTSRLNKLQKNKKTAGLLGFRIWNLKKPVTVFSWSFSKKDRITSVIPPIQGLNSVKVSYCKNAVPSYCIVVLVQLLGFYGCFKTDIWMSWRCRGCCTVPYPETPSLVVPLLYTFTLKFSKK